MTVYQAVCARLATGCNLPYKIPVLTLSTVNNNQTPSVLTYNAVVVFLFSIFPKYEEVHEVIMRSK